jgi:triosephosphate isomerase
VDGLGGDSGSILPSPTGVPFPRPGHGEHEHEKHRVYTGKVCEVLYDCFGEFEGFVLESCERRRTFHTRAKGIESVALRACREQLTQMVIVEEEEREKGEDDHDAHDRQRIVRLALRR